MADPQISATVVYQMIQSLDDRVTTQHTRLRADMQDGFRDAIDESRKLGERMVGVEVQLRNVYENGCKAFSDCQPTGLGKRHVAWVGGAGAFLAAAYELLKHRPPL